MKLWEVIKALTDDQTKVYEAKLQGKDWIARMRVDTGLSRYFKFDVFDGKKLINPLINGGGFNGNVALGLDWREVKQPVTWQEAIQAWADGGSIKWVSQDSNLVRVYNQSHLNDDQRIAMHNGQINHGTWYIEE